jgi:hypothetical protein
MKRVFLDQFTGTNTGANQADVDREGGSLAIGLDVDFEHLTDREVGEVLERGNCIATKTHGFFTTRYFFAGASTSHHVAHRSRFHGNAELFQPSGLARNRETEAVGTGVFQDEGHTVTDAIDYVVFDAALGVQLVG